MFCIDLSGKIGVVTGVANKWSIAWAIASHLRQAGAQLVLPYLSDREKRGIEKLLESEGWSDVILPPDPCNAGEDDDIARMFDFVGNEVGCIDAFVHSIAFAPSGALTGAYAETSREAFRIALDISAFSFVAMTRAAAGLMNEGGSVICLTFMASERVFPSYNVMGTAKAALEQAMRQLAFELGPQNIRVNAVSPGPISTVSARGVSGFGDFQKIYQERAPLRRTITQDEVGKVGLFLLSNMASGITGEVVHVDGGYNIVGI